MEPNSGEKRWGFMGDNPLSWLTVALESEVLIAGLIFAVTTIVIALWVPGVLLPIAASSGALLDTWSATTAVTFGALAGSLIIFATTRHFARDRIPPGIARFLHRFETGFKSRGAWLVLGLRLIGAPHFLVSAGSAAMPVKTSSFALATLLGLLPAILLAAMAGSALGN